MPCLLLSQHIGCASGGSNQCAGAAQRCGGCCFTLEEGWAHEPICSPWPANCPTEQDVWLEAARLQTPENAKAILARGVAALPDSGAPRPPVRSPIGSLVLACALLALANGFHVLPCPHSHTLSGAYALRTVPSLPACCSTGHTAELSQFSLLTRASTPAANPACCLRPRSQVVDAGGAAGDDGRCQEARAAACAGAHPSGGCCGLDRALAACPLLPLPYTSTLWDTPRAVRAVLRKPACSPSR